MVSGVMNQAANRWQEYVEHFIEVIEEKVGMFEDYAASKDGQERIAQVQLISTFAAAIILGVVSPFTVAISAGVGFVAGALSDDQVEDIKKTFSRISNNLPASVKALAVVITFIYTPILFPIMGGMCAGFEVGARISPSLLAKGMDKVVDDEFVV